ncbi:MAG: arylsulfatase A-like enzyme [Planctomycetota bacterium]|jgi:arylsulfatase A-like enzyme
MHNRIATRLVNYLRGFTLPLSLVLFAACSGGSDASIVRVLEHVQEGSMVQNSTTGESSVLVDGRAGFDENWFAIGVEGMVPLEQAPDDVFQNDAGDLLLGPTGSAWIRLVEVEPGTDLVLTAEIDGEGLGIDFKEPFCNLGLLRFDEMPARREVHDLLLDSKLIANWTPNYPHHLGASTPQLIATLGERTHAVAVVCLFTPLVGDSAARVRYSNVVLRSASAADRRAAIVRHELEQGNSTEIAFGEVEIGMTTRSGICLLAGEEATVPVVVPTSEASLEVHFGIPVGQDDPFAPAAGQGLALTCELVLEGGAAPIVSLNAALTSMPFGDGRWKFASNSIPESARGKRGQVVFRVRTLGEQGEVNAAWPAGIFAEPRLVPAEPKRVGPNLVLISVDTLRADRLGCYGYDRDTTPNIDAFAKEARIYTDVWASSCYTLPSHMSLFTGQMPSMHTVTKPGVLRNPSRSPMLAEILQKRGYTTAAFTGGVFVDREFGFAAGFESYNSVDLVQLKTSSLTENRIHEVPGLTAELIEENDMGVLTDWLGKHRSESFFLFFHTYAAHEFDPPKHHRQALGFEGSLSDDLESQRLIGGGGVDPSEAEVARLFDLYDGGVRFADEGVGVLFDELKRLNLLGNTVVILTADHGKEIGEHGVVGHGHALYDEMLRIPLLIRLPISLIDAGRNRGVSQDDRPLMLVDVLPTILEVLNIGLPGNVQGSSAFGAITTNRTRLAEVENLAIKYALQTGSLKTIYSPLDAPALIKNEIEEETFDLESDPSELNALEPSAERVDRLTREFELLKTRSRALGETLESGQMSAATAANLKALGYVEDAKRN